MKTEKIIGNTILILFGVTLFIALLLGEKEGDFNKNYGKSKYRVSLFNERGEIISTRFAHEYTESLDWGMYRNYEFTYYYFRKRIMKG